MTKRKTPGERIAKSREKWSTGIVYFPDTLAHFIDRAIRKAQAEAWDEGYTDGQMGGTPENPYRGRARK